MKSQYFSHDYNARNDSKLISLQMKLGMEGLGIYWCLVEMLYESGGEIMLSECERIAFELRTDIKNIKSVISDFGLFKKDKKVFFSESVNYRLQIRKDKSIKARASASARWDNANGVRTHSERNANGMLIKEKKSKENNKEIIIKEIGENFVEPVNLWLKYKKEKKQTYKETGFITFLKKLNKLSGGDPKIAMEIIENSMANNYQGIFPMKENNQVQKANQSYR